MIVDQNGTPCPATGGGLHWAMLAALQREPALYDPLRDAISSQLSAHISAGDTDLDSARIGAAALAALPSSWFGSFHRRFQDFPNGADGGLSGMETYCQLAMRAETLAADPRTADAGREPEDATPATSITIPKRSAPTLVRSDDVSNVLTGERATCRFREYGSASRVASCPGKPPRPADLWQGRPRT